MLQKRRRNILKFFTSLETAIEIWFLKDQAITTRQQKRTFIDKS